ncbi:unnamed protein product [Onchocerca flexuosa]|uniref:TMEM132D_N domain-containing protein n=1 Tax=Onchocerca flexuosa TaxID=387005 RepID=A0A183I1T6_9BILA|nr:unnamed protein product [Onchocerca flexuosa]
MIIVFLCVFSLVLLRFFSDAFCWFTGDTAPKFSTKNEINYIHTNSNEEDLEDHPLPNMDVLDLFGPKLPLTVNKKESEDLHRETVHDKLNASRFEVTSLHGEQTKHAYCISENITNYRLSLTTGYT